MNFLHSSFADVSVQLLYSRMHLFKTLAAQLLNEPTPIPKLNSLSQSLGILADVSKLGDRYADAVHFYDLLLSSCEKLFDNELEQHAFEDQMRYMFGIEVKFISYPISCIVLIVSHISIRTRFSPWTSSSVLSLSRYATK